MSDRILVIKLSALGDFLVAISSMQAIRKHHPNASICLLTTKPFAALAEKSKLFDEIFIDRRPRFSNLKEWLHLRKFLNDRNFSRVYDLQLNNRTSIYYKLFKRKPEWIGVIKQASHCFSHADWRNMHAYQRHVAILAEVGIYAAPPDLSWMKEESSSFSLPKPYVLLVPGSAPSHPEKRWPEMHFASLARELGKSGMHPVLVGTAADLSAINGILSIYPDIINLCGKTTLFDLAGLASEALGAVGNDTGPTHLIAMSGCPTVAIFSGSTSPSLSAPIGDKVAIVQENELKDLEPRNVFLRLKELVKL